MKHTIDGPFDVKLLPQEDANDPSGIGRLLLDKAFHGALEATSRGFALTPTGLATLQHALAAAEQSGCSPRELFFLRKRLLQLSAYIDLDVSAVAEPLLARLGRDAGLDLFDPRDPDPAQYGARCFPHAQQRHDALPEQSAERFVKFIDSFNSPWVGQYYDIGNHWKYGQPREWLKAFGRRAVKLDVKGFSRAKNKFVDITSPDDDLPWDKVREALAEVGFTGWSTAEVGGGDVKRLTIVREQMQKALRV